jgi:hypothetical protein
MQRVRWLLVPIAFFLLSLAGTVIVARGDYPVGLDFRGGIHLVFDLGDPGAVDVPAECRTSRRGSTVSVECDDLGQRDADAISARTRALGGTIDSVAVIEPGRPRWQGRPLALALCLLAGLLAIAVALLRGRGWLVASAGATVVAGALAWWLNRGTTFTMAMYLAAVWLAAPAALIGWLVRGDRPLERARRSWLGWALLLIVIAIASAISNLTPEPTYPRVLARAAGTLVLQSGPIVFAVAALCLFFVPHPKPA